MFIKLTDRNDDEVYINANAITYMEKAGNHTYISAVDCSFEVKETPEEIIETINIVNTISI